MIKSSRKPNENYSNYYWYISNLVVTIIAAFLIFRGTLEIILSTEVFENILVALTLYGVPYLYFHFQLKIGQIR